MCNLRPLAARALLAAILGLGASAAQADEADEAGDILRAVLAVACGNGAEELAEMARKLPHEATGVTDRAIEFAGRRIGWRRRFRLATGAELEVHRLAPGGTLRRLGADYLEPATAGPRPLMTAIAGGDCVIRLGRRLTYGADGAAKSLEFLDGSLTPTGVSEPLDAAVPPGEDPGGVAVALVDSGVNYLLPEIAAALARDADGVALGYDYWDLDARPFDSNPARSPFFPARHGTRVASVLIREAPAIRLLAYRYPRPDLSRLARLVEDAAAKGVRVINVSLGSSKAKPWGAFEEAARARPEILFVVSAGNDGRNIDEEPVYPAALTLGNMIVVTSANAFGTLAEGSNWGRRSVDLLVPGERMPVLTFRGEAGRASGSSFAAPRVAALAARLLARHPSWGAPELKNAIFARATMTDAGGPPVVSQGFIANPLGD